MRKYLILSLAAVLAILLDGPVKLYKGAGQVITAN